MNKKKIILLGGGGHAKVVIDAIKEAGGFTIYGIADPKLKKGASILGVPVIGTDEILAKLIKQGIKDAFVSVGSIGDCEVRKKLCNNVKKIGYRLPVIKHPKAVIAKDVELKEGAFIAAGVVVNPGTKIGRNAIINTSASIDHDCEIGDFVHIAPGAVLSGGVKVGDETHIGTGAAVIQNLTIGKRCTIGAGQTIRHDMADGSKSFGQGASH